MSALLLGAVLVAGAAGAVIRHLVAGALAGSGTAPQTGTLAVNITGSFALGALAGASVEPTTLAIVGTGFLGALTTFSTFAVETASLAAADRRWAAGYLVLMVASCALAAAAGLALSRVLWP